MSISSQWYARRDGNCLVWHDGNGNIATDEIRRYISPPSGIYNGPKTKEKYVSSSNRQIELRQKVKEKQSENCSQLYREAYSLFESHKYDYTIALCDRALKCNARHVPSWELKGYALQEKRLYDAALECFNQILKISDHRPHLYNAWYQKTSLYKIKEDHEHVIQSVYKTFKYFVNDQTPTAWKEWTTLWHMQGVAHSHLKDFERAHECFKRILTVQPDNKSSIKWNILTLNELNRFNEALEWSEKFTKIYPNDSDAWIHKGIVLNHLKKYNDAIVALDKSFSLDSSCPYPLRHKGIALTSLGSYEKAIEVFKTALKMDSGYKEAWASMGDALVLQAKVYPKAKKCYNKALSIDSTYKPAKEGLANIERIVERSLSSESEEYPPDDDE